MKKRTKFLLVIVGLALVLTVGLTTTALASDGDGNGPVQTFISKVANILGLDEEQVADAFQQAHSEMRDEAFEKRLQKAVESGSIAEEDADQILEWWQNKPEAVGELGLLGNGSCIRIRLHDGLMGHRMCRCPAEPPLMRIFDQHVSGTITSVSEEDVTITVITEDGSEVSFQYTSHTRFVLQGVTAVAAGQTVEAWCWEDAEGDLTAKLVKVELPQEEDVSEGGEVT